MRGNHWESLGITRCILCDLTAEGRGWFGWKHDRANWKDPKNRRAMARAHGLEPARGGNVIKGPWVRIREDDLVEEDGRLYRREFLEMVAREDAEGYRKMHGLPMEDRC